MSKQREPVLCYVSGPWAYFTTQPLADQWGDDWNDAPYEHNAGTPYWPHGDDEGKWEIVRVAWEGPFDTPSENVSNSTWSVEAINAGAVAWLTNVTSWGYNKYKDVPVSIFAGTDLANFKLMIRLGGGQVYVMEEGKL